MATKATKNHVLRIREQVLSFGEPAPQVPGPFVASQIQPGSRYELSNGHPVYCMPSGKRGGRSNLVGGEVLETDPSVKSAGVDVGFALQENGLRAPDVSVGDFENEPGWAPGAPPLAVEYADTGQDEGELRKKIAELLAAGTKHLWVVRLVGSPRVEVFEPGKPMRTARPGEDLVAPGILKNPVPVLAMFDRGAAHEATLRNLLQRKGYESLDAVRAEGEARGRAEGEARGRQDVLLGMLAARGLRVAKKAEERIRATIDKATLDGWVLRAITAASVAELFEDKAKQAPRKKAARAKR
ncbi:MAG: Uma2 family endonuclease [Polyangiaceae bacterium]|nr:Uma2 family endonuclease [Polyangiaceae bacterium]